MVRTGLFQPGRPDQFPPTSNVRSTFPSHGSCTVAVTFETLGFGSIVNSTVLSPTSGGSIVTVIVAVPESTLFEQEISYWLAVSRSTPFKYTVTLGTTALPVHGYPCGSMPSTTIGRNTAFTVTSFVGMRKLVSLADMSAKSTPSQYAHCANASPGWGSLAVTVTTDPSAADTFVVLPPSTVTVWNGATHVRTKVFP